MAQDDARDAVTPPAPLRLGAIARSAVAMVWGFLVAIVFYSVPAFCIALLLLPFGRQRDFCDWWIVRWTGVLRTLYGVELEVTGLSKLSPNTTYILVSNHRSWLDAIALLAAFDGYVPFGFMIKRELTWIPLAGWFMQLAGYVPVDRGRRGEGRRKLSVAAEAIRAGRSVLIFPEGTRAPGHRFASFKAGAAKLAMEAGCALVPVTVSGTGRLWPKGTPWVRPGQVRVDIGAPVSPADYDSPRALTRAFAQTIADAYRPEVDGPPLSATPERWASLTAAIPLPPSVEPRAGADAERQDGEGNARA